MGKYEEELKAAEEQRYVAKNYYNNISAMKNKLLIKKIEKKYDAMPDDKKEEFKIKYAKYFVTPEQLEEARTNWLVSERNLEIVRCSNETQKKPLEPSNCRADAFSNMPNPGF